MLQLALPKRNHKNGNSPRESDLVRADDTARGAEATATHDTDLETDIGSLDADVVQELGPIRQRLCRLRARLADLKRRLASFEPSTKQ